MNKKYALLAVGAGVALVAVFLAYTYLPMLAGDRPTLMYFHSPT